MNRPQALKKRILQVYQEEKGQPLDHFVSKDNNNAQFNEKQNNEPLERIIIINGNNSNRCHNPMKSVSFFFQISIILNNISSFFESCQPLVSANQTAQQYHQLPIAASNAASVFASVPNNTADWNYKQLQNQQPFEIGHFLMPEHHHPQQHQQQPSNITNKAAQQLCHQLPTSEKKEDAGANSAFAYSTLNRTADGRGDARRQHRRSKPKHPCEKCPKAYSTVPLLKQHVLFTHTGDGRNECKVCQRKLASPYSLQKHLLMHAKKLPFECHLCPRKCATLANLAAHICSHTEVKPFPCTACPAAFTRKVELDAHFGCIHSGEEALPVPAVPGSICPK
ncbi:hypothetical protein TYRP_009876, partial [Tyrophagus putrescentiae]